MELTLHSEIRDIKFSYDTLVVGSNLEALVYSYLNNLPFVCAQLMPPQRFEYFNINDDLDVFGVTNICRVLETNSSEKTCGTDKLYLWEKLYFYLSLAGLNAINDKAVSIRVEDQLLKVMTPAARMAKIHFNKLIVFDDTGVLGLGVPKVKDNSYTVYDWLSVRSGMKHDYDRIEDTTDFVNHILFYPSDRVEGDHNFKDAVAVSYLSKNNLNDVEYSDINARFKARYMMKGAGIRGARNGRSMTDKTKFKYYALKVENRSREIVAPKNIYDSLSNIVFNYDSFDDIIKQNPLKESYVSRLLTRMC